MKRDETGAFILYWCWKKEEEKGIVKGHRETKEKGRGSGGPSQLGLDVLGRNSDIGC